MGGVDDEFEDFLRRRKPVFRSPDDMFEPPAELDRVVLRQAREAIESERPMKVFHGPRWAAPVALAATLLLAVTIIFQAGLPPKHAPVPEVTVQNIAESIEIPEPATANKAREDASASDAAGDAVVVDLATPMVAKRQTNAPALVSSAEAERYAAPPPPAVPMAASSPSGSTAAGAPPVVVTASSGTSPEVPTWRRDPTTWKAEIERLRNAGDIARADAELAEFNRQQRAYAVGPDR